MAEFLSQNEIDDLLGYPKDDNITDEGSDDYQKELKRYKETFDNNEEYDPRIYIPMINPSSPGEFLDKMERDNKHFLKVLDTYNNFKDHYKRFKELERTQPALFV